MVDCLRNSIENLIVPPEAPYFEAMGCALWARTNPTATLNGRDELFKEGAASFSFLPPLEKARGKVEFKSTPPETAKPYDRCILGLDVGSTTTKAVLVREKGQSILASIYLRTDGDPIRASRACYAGIVEQAGALNDIA